MRVRGFRFGGGGFFLVGPNRELHGTANEHNANQAGHVNQFAEEIARVHSQNVVRPPGGGAMQPQTITAMKAINSNPTQAPERMIFRNRTQFTAPVQKMIQAAKARYSPKFG